MVIRWMLSGVGPCLPATLWVRKVGAGSCLNPSQARRYSIYLPGGMEGWVDVGGWLYTEMVYLPADSRRRIQVVTTW